MNRLMTWIPGAALALALLAACGGGNHTPPNITAAAGGTVVSDDGRVTLTVPPGAAPRDMTVRIVQTTPDAPATIGLLPGYGYAIEGDGGELVADAQISVAIDASALPSAAASERSHALAASVINIPPINCGLNGMETPVDYYDLWNTAWYCVPFPFEPRLATVTRDAVTALDACAFEAASKTATCVVRTLVPKIFGVVFDAEPPTVSVTANPLSVSVAGDVLITATAADNKGLANVAIAMVRSVNGVVDPASVSTTPFAGAPYQFTRSFTHADNGVWTITAAASDFNSNVTTTDGLLTVTVNIPAPAGPDVTPPVVGLAASPSNAVVGDTATLSAAASDNVGVTKVEFYKGALKLGERLAAPFDFSPAAYVAGDVGTPQVYTAKAFDAAGNTATSAPVTVVVSAASAGNFYVNAGSGNDSNAGTSAAPFKTLAKAFSVVPANGTVWLHNGVFDIAGEGTDVFTGRTVPANVTVQAVNDGGATIAFPLKFAASGNVSGVQFDISGRGIVIATNGTVNVSLPTWVKLGSVNASAAIEASGTAKVFVDPKGNNAHSYFAAAGMSQLAYLIDSAELTVNGGVIDRLSGSGAGFLSAVANSSRLTLNNVSWIDSAAIVVAPTVVEVLSGASKVAFNNTTVDFTGGVDPNGGGNACIRVRGLPGDVTTQTITLTNSMLKGCPGDAVQIRGGTPSFSFSNSTISGAKFYGIRAGKVFGQPEEATPAITLVNSTVAGSGYAGIDLNGGGSVTLTGSTISNNGLLVAQGGVQLRDVKAYTLTVRNSAISDNAGTSTSGGIVLEGNATSVFDLGKKGALGGNSLKNNGAASTGLRVSVATGVTVQAVGNTWNAGTQGADASGLYTPASSVCSGANPCTVNTGSGANFAITGGALRLVDN